MYENTKKQTAEREKEVLKFWKENKIFEKTLAKKSPEGEFVFYDGPPFATGLPHYGHILAGLIKDAIPRYKTMKGYHVRRRWGWDCHGLPLENLIEKELDLKTKKEIEEYGINRFNKAAKESVLRYADDWREIIPRTGRWVDMDASYRTMDSSYTESVWWVFKTLFDKGLVYEGFKPMHLCPRCETTLSNFEVSQGYTEITDLAVTVEFEVKNPEKFGLKNNTRLLAWTTTPWTLPGNMALAVNPDIEYAVIEKKDMGDGPLVRFILADALLEKIFGSEGYSVVGKKKGEKLVGLEYEPPFDYYKNAALPHKENAWKVYAAPFVSTNEGTGIVHIAPAFGEDDMRLAENNQIPIVHHVGTDGKFKSEVRDFAGLSVKPKGDHQRTDIEIIKYFAGKNILFDKEKITHSYPLCWRCETPLLNYAANSWFVAVTKIKDKLVAANENIRWVPGDIKEGRFGNWLRGARDWAISRSRYWGAPIPVWRNEKTKQSVVIGSLEELKRRVKKSGNTYFMMRHGEADNNVIKVVSGEVENNHHLTERGREQARKSAALFKSKKIDLVISSPLARAKETAEIFAEEINYPKEKILFDIRLREVIFGSFEGKQTGEYHAQFPKEERFTRAPVGGETLVDQKKRMAAFLYEIEEKYADKNILIVSHSDPLWMLYAGARGLGRDEIFSSDDTEFDFLKNAEIRELSFVPLPHNGEFELDLHRPYIDEVELIDDDGAPLRRVLDVFDCWFESGSMPYGESHYPFGNKKIFDPLHEKGFPADFIAEGLDQTRGWFYSLLVLAVALFGKTAYKNVIVNGLILAEDGRKMSKRLKNYPDPVEILNKYGADALRFYLLSSPVTRAEDINFSEKGVKETESKIVARALNVLAFYELYARELPTTNYQLPTVGSNILDQWIHARLKETINAVSVYMDRYELDKAMRPLALFIDDLSTWYLRRSRERLKSADSAVCAPARATLQHTLLEFSKTIAPFMPFVAEELYRSAGGAKESVHLEDWPAHASVSKVSEFLRGFWKGGQGREIIPDMNSVRAIVSEGLLARAKAGIRVRQPLAMLKIRNPKSEIRNNEELVQLIKDEVNVKDVMFGADIQDDIALDTEITPELKKEGQTRELIRAVQELRKQNNLTPDERAGLLVQADEESRAFLEEHDVALKETANLGAIEFRDGVEGEEVIIDDMIFLLKLISNSPNS